MTISIPVGKITYGKLTHVRSIDTPDIALPGEKNRGLGCADFDEIVLVGTPLGGATAFTVDVYFWSEAKDGTLNGGFVPDITPISLSFTASGQRALVRVAHSDSVWFHVPSITGGSGERVRLEIAGVPVFNRVG